MIPTNMAWQYGRVKSNALNVRREPSRKARRWNNVWPMYAAGIPVNLSQSACTALTMVLLGKPLLEKLDRIKLKSGLEE